MSHRTHHAVLFVMLSAAQAMGQGTVTVQIRRDGAFGPPLLFDAGRMISLSDLDDRVDFIRAYSTTELVDIGPIRLAGPRTTLARLAVLLGRGETMPSPGATLEPVARSWSGLTAAAAIEDAVFLSGAISGDLTGAVTVGAIGRLQLPSSGEAGRILAPMTLIGEFGEARPSLESLVCRELAPGALIETLRGGLGELTFGVDGAGGVFGSILAAEGVIEILRVAGPIAVPPPGRVLAGLGIGIITARRIDARIETVDEDSQGGSLRAMHVQPGPIEGTVIVGSVGTEADDTTGIHCDGEVRGLIQVTGDLNAEIHAGSFGPESHILIVGNARAPITSGSRLERLTVLGNIGPAGFPAPGTPFGVSIVAPAGIGRFHVAGSVVEGPDQVIPYVSAPRIEELIVDENCLCGLSGAAAASDCELGNARIGGDLVPRGWRIGRFESFDVLGSVLIDIPREGLVFDVIQPGTSLRIGRNLTGIGRVRRPQGLSGQVVANALGASSVWAGSWSVGTPPSEITLAPAPHYTARSEAFGGGAIGEVPYLLHNHESSPSTVCARGFMDGWTAVRLAFRGPIGIGTRSPIRLLQVAPTGHTTPIPESTYSAFVSPANPRHLLVRSAPGSEFVPGVLYRIVPIGAGPDRLRCEATLLADPPAVRDFVYQFRLVGGCGSPECGSPAACACVGHCDSADYNADGGTDGADVEAFFLAWENGSADVNLDGGTDGADVESFFCWWQTGGC